MLKINSGEKQICFATKDGIYTLCNYVIRNNTEVWSNTGKWLRIPRLCWVKKQKTLDPDQRKTKASDSKKA